MKKKNYDCDGRRAYLRICVCVCEYFCGLNSSSLAHQRHFFRSICLSGMCRCVSVCLCVLSRLHALRTHALTQDSNRKLCNVNLLRTMTHRPTHAHAHRTKQMVMRSAVQMNRENLPDWFICFFTKLNSQRALSNGSFTSTYRHRLLLLVTNFHWTERKRNYSFICHPNIPFSTLQIRIRQP